MGNVTLVVAVDVSVVANAPEVVKLPPKVIVFPVLATPVPPYWPAITEPFQVPELIVPTDVKLDARIPGPRPELLKTCVAFIS